MTLSSIAKCLILSLILSNTAIADVTNNSHLSTEEFRHWYNQVLSDTSYPHHFASDSVGVIGHKVVIEGKFTYGPALKDLTDEWVLFTVKSGEQELQFKTLTDDDGRARWEISADQLPEVGRYTITMKVLGDDTETANTLTILKPKSTIVVFDVDSTLTVSDFEPFKDALCWEDDSCSYQTIRAGAQSITHFRRNQGNHLVYVVGRHYMLTNMTRNWLNKEHFATGSLMLAQSITDWVPDESHVGEFKKSYLLHLKSMGLRLVAGYGNAISDIYAYLGAGIPHKNAYIVGENGGYSNTISLGEDYEKHLIELRKSE